MIGRWSRFRLLLHAFPLSLPYRLFAGLSTARWGSGRTPGFIFNGILHWDRINILIIFYLSLESSQYYTGRTNCFFPTG